MNKWLLLLLCLCFSARAEQPLTSLTGETIALDDSTPVHLVFFDLWTAYGGEGPDKLVASLPVSYREEHRIVWVQPRLNVTDAQLHEFQQAMPAYRPLVVDENFQLMRRYGLDRAEARAEYGRLLAEVLAGQERTYDGQFRNRVQVPCQVTAAGGRQVPSLLVYDCQEQAIVTVFRRSNRLKRHRLEPKTRRIA